MLLMQAGTGSSPPVTPLKPRETAACGEWLLRLRQVFAEGKNIAPSEELRSFKACQPFVSQLGYEACFENLQCTITASMVSTSTILYYGFSREKLDRIIHLVYHGKRGRWLVIDRILIQKEREVSVLLLI